jgi:phage baseplate assembly protein W
MAKPSPKPFLGVGWGFPLSVNGNGLINLAEDEKSVFQAIWIILGTAKGERAMRPDFGCGIYDLVFEMNSAATAGKVAQAVRDSLLMFEPRIDVRDVQVRAQQGGEVLLISIDYEIRATNNAFNLVYPFYLERSANR